MLHALRDEGRIRARAVRWVAATGGVAASLVVACAAPARPVAVRELPSAATVRRDPASGTVRWAEAADLGAELAAVDPGFRAARDAGRHEEAGRAWLAAYAAALRLDRPAEELVATSVSTDPLGRTRVAFAQRWSGLPVDGAALSVHFDAEGRLVVVNGAYLPTPRGLDARPALDAAAARERAALAQGEAAGACSGCSAELVVLPVEGAGPRLAWRVGPPPGRLRGREVVIDAHSGATLRSLPAAIPSRPPAREGGG